MAERIIEERNFSVGIKSTSSLILLGLILSLSFLMVSCGGNKKWHKEQGMIWNTVWHATFCGPADAISAAVDSLKAVESSVSAFDDNSLVSIINRNENGPVDSHFKNVYEMSKKINSISDGLFDPTLSPLIKAWGFGKGHTPTSDTARIESILTYVGIDKTRIENDTLFKSSKEVSFNFSAIAKGYGVDVAAKTLIDHGCTDLMFEIGGEVVCIGKNPEGKKWRILIETPDEEFLREVFKTESRPEFGEALIVELSDEALATSGNYRNYHTESGQTFGHTISPLTGRPVKTDILSASVIAPTCMEADALATACMALGSGKALDMLDKVDAAGAFILYSGDILVNDQMKRHIAKSN